MTNRGYRYRYPSEPRWVVETLPPHAPWRNFVLCICHSDLRGNYRLSHNGVRFGLGGEWRSLCDDFPSISVEITEWAEQVALWALPADSTPARTP
jgi:hypothetical protein